jgi:hypothetical protein
MNENEAVPIYVAGVDVQGGVTVQVKRFPSIFQSAQWRGTTPIDLDSMTGGVSFLRDDGTKAYFRLPVAHLKHLVGSILNYLHAAGLSEVSDPFAQIVGDAESAGVDPI